MPILQPTGSVAIGRYVLAVGAPAGTFIAPDPVGSDDAKAEVAEALSEPTAGEVFEGTVADGQEATARVEQAERLLRAALAGSLPDPADLSEHAGEMLKALGRLDKDGRYEEWLRYARAINGLLALGMRWAKLVGSLRDTLRAAEHVPGLERAVAWVEHELGTLHLAIDDATGAERRLERAREIRQRLGDNEGLAATEQSLGVLCRQQALARRLHRRQRAGRGLVLALAAAFLLLIGGVAGAILDPVGTANALTVRIDGPGTVTSAPDAIRCPDTCDAEFAADKSVLLTASARPGATFTGWSGDCSGARRCRVRVDRARSVTAQFENSVQGRTVRVTLTGDGEGEVASAAGIACPGSCRTSVKRGSRVRLVPTPLGSSTFAGWSGADCEGTDPCAFTVDESVTIDARFAAAPPDEVSLTVIPAGGGSGTVTSSPEGIVCGNECVRTFPSGSEVILKQAADEGSDFAGWSDADCSENEQCTVKLTEPRQITATFRLEAAVEFTLTTSDGITATTGSDDVGDDCTAGCRYPKGTNVTLSAAPPAGTTTVWTGCSAPEGEPDTCTVIMDMDRTVSVRFASSIQ